MKKSEKVLKSDNQKSNSRIVSLGKASSLTKGGGRMYIEQSQRYGR